MFNTVLSGGGPLNDEFRRYMLSFVIGVIGTAIIAFMAAYFFLLTPFNMADRYDIPLSFQPVIVAIYVSIIWTVVVLSGKSEMLYQHLKIRKNDRD